MGRLESVFEKFTPFFLRFANAKPTLAIKDGFILTMPMTIIGSLSINSRCPDSRLGRGYGEILWRTVEPSTYPGCRFYI